jgi:hypothetical protein
MSSSQSNEGETFRDRVAACSCGDLSVVVTGDPVRVSMCHCHACQRRTGSAFGVQARWPKDRVLFRGSSMEYERRGDTGGLIRFHFCSQCGATVYYFVLAQPDLVAIPVGAFADSRFPPPTVSVYESRRHEWVSVDHIVEHHD